MDVRVLAAKLRRLHDWMENDTRPPTAIRHQFTQPPFGGAEVIVDPASTAKAASFNRNRIYLCGSEGGLTPEGLNAMVRLFDAQRVSRFFAWLSPGPDMELVREWLGALGFVKVPWTRYPTLVHSGQAAIPVHSDHSILRVGSDEIAAAPAAVKEIMMEGFAASVGKPGCHHYMAFDDNRPVAVAALIQFEELGYLTYASTAPADRRRGAQSALIAHRIAHARALGCTQIVSQTLTMLAESFANLKRAGFREVCEQEVYECVRPAS